MQDSGQIFYKQFIAAVFSILIFMKYFWGSICFFLNVMVFYNIGVIFSGLDREIIIINYKVWIEFCILELWFVIWEETFSNKVILKLRGKKEGLHRTRHF